MIFPKNMHCTSYKSKNMLRWSFTRQTVLDRCTHRICFNMFSVRLIRDAAKLDLRFYIKSKVRVNHSFSFQNSLMTLREARMSRAACKPCLFTVSWYTLNILSLSCEKPSNVILCTQPGGECQRYITVGLVSFQT